MSIGDKYGTNTGLPAPPSGSVPQPRVHRPEVGKRVRADRLPALDEWDPEDIAPGVQVAAWVTPDAPNVLETPHQRRCDEIAKGQIPPGDDALGHPLQPQ